MARLIWSVAIGFVLFAVSPQTVFAQARLASAFGEANIGGQRVFVHATVVVPPGLDGNTVAQAAIRDQGGRPFQPTEFLLNGLVWDQFINAQATDNPQVVQLYNNSGAPVEVEKLDEAAASVGNSQTTWSGVVKSIFSFLGGTTSRCPSLVKQCRGPQTFDGENGVGWLDLKRMLHTSRHMV